MPCQFWWCAFDKKILRKLAQHTPARTFASIAKMGGGVTILTGGFGLTLKNSVVFPSLKQGQILVPIAPIRVEATTPRAIGVSARKKGQFSSSPGNGKRNG